MSDSRNSLRVKIRQFIREASGISELPPGLDGDELSSSKSSDGPKRSEKSDKETGTIMVSQKPDMTLQSTVVEIAKAAAYGMERIELLKKRDFPTHNAANAVGNAVDALEAIFQDMLRNPMDYLDEDPEQQVADYEQYLDDEQARLS